MIGSISKFESVSFVLRGQNMVGPIISDGLITNTTYYHFVGWKNSSAGLEAVICQTLSRLLIRPAPC